MANCKLCTCVRIVLVVFCGKEIGACVHICFHPFLEAEYVGYLSDCQINSTNTWRIFCFILRIFVNAT